MQGEICHEKKDFYQFTGVLAPGVVILFGLIHLYLGNNYA